MPKKDLRCISCAHYDNCPRCWTVDTIRHVDECQHYEKQAMYQYYKDAVARNGEIVLSVAAFAKSPAQAEILASAIARELNAAYELGKNNAYPDDASIAGKEEN